MSSSVSQIGRACILRLIIYMSTVRAVDKGRRGERLTPYTATVLRSKPGSRNSQASRTRGQRPYLCHLPLLLRPRRGCEHRGQGLSPFHHNKALILSIFKGLNTQNDYSITCCLSFLPLVFHCYSCLWSDYFFDLKN